MQESIEEKLSIEYQKIAALEKELSNTKDLLMSTIDSLKDTQRYLLALAHNQSEITKRVSYWPFLPVNVHRGEDDHT
jgi:hypothetical protein